MFWLLKHAEDSFPSFFSLYKDTCPSWVLYNLVSSLPQWQQRCWVGIFLFFSCCPVGRRSWATLRKTIFILGGAIIFHSFFHSIADFDWSDLSALPFTEAFRKIASLFAIMYADLTVYMPDLVNGHEATSSVLLWLKGILTMRSASAGLKQACTSSSFHCLVSSSIKKSTVSSPGRGTSGTIGWHGAWDSGMGKTAESGRVQLDALRFVCKTSKSMGKKHSCKL